MKTIKELEKSIGVSKVSLYNIIKRSDIKPHVFKGKNNITLIGEIGVQLIIQHYNTEKSVTINDFIEDSKGEVNPGADTNKGNSKEVKNSDIIRNLQDQIKIKDEEINSLLNIIDNQQKLHATQLITENTEIISDDNITEKNQKSNLLQRIFKWKKENS